LVARESPIINSGRNYPFVNVEIRFSDINETNYNILTESCLVDTGFSGAVFIPLDKIAEALVVGTKTVNETINLAGDVKQTVKCCLGSITKIMNYEINPPLEITVIFNGKGHGLLGREVINKWVSEFHGPNQILNIFENI
jgi:predicted aspartyl protease